MTIRTTRIKSTQAPKVVALDLSSQLNGSRQTFSLPRKVHTYDRHYIVWNSTVYHNDANHTYYSISDDGLVIRTYFDVAPSAGPSHTLQLVVDMAGDSTDNAATKADIDKAVDDLDEKLTGQINAESAERAKADAALDAKISAETTVRGDEDKKLSDRIDAEAEAREQADEKLAKSIEGLSDTDIDLQSQIDAINNASDVKDVVQDHATLDKYDKKSLSDNDIIKVLKDENHENATTYYRYQKNSDIFDYIGQTGPYPTTSEVDEKIAGVERQIFEAKEAAADAKGAAADARDAAREAIAAVDGKQDKLVSGVNIKTINGESLLGEGDMEIKGGDELTADLMNQLKIEYGKQFFDGESITAAMRLDEQVEKIDGLIFNPDYIMIDDWGDAVKPGAVFVPSEGDYNVQQYPVLKYLRIVYNGGDKRELSSYTINNIPAPEEIEGYVSFNLRQLNVEGYGAYGNFQFHGTVQGQYDSALGQYVKISSIDPLQVDLMFGDEVIKTYYPNVYDYVRFDDALDSVYIDKDYRWSHGDFFLTDTQLDTILHPYVTFGDAGGDGTEENPLGTYGDLVKYVNKWLPVLKIKNAKVAPIGHRVAPPGNQAPANIYVKMAVEDSWIYDTVVRDYCEPTFRIIFDRDRASEYNSTYYIYAPDGGCLDYYAMTLSNATIIYRPARGNAQQLRYGNVKNLYVENVNNAYGNGGKVTGTLEIGNYQGRDWLPDANAVLFHSNNTFKSFSNMHPNATTFCLPPDSSLTASAFSNNLATYNISLTNPGTLDLYAYARSNGTYNQTVNFTASPGVSSLVSDYPYFRVPSVVNIYYQKPYSTSYKFANITMNFPDDEYVVVNIEEPLYSAGYFKVNGAHVTVQPMESAGSSLKLYSAYGTATDGAVTQKFISDKLNSTYLILGPNASANTTYYGMAIGQYAKAGGGSAIAFGGYTDASENGAVALGYGAKAQATEAVAIGEFAESTQYGSVALGDYSKVSRSGEISVGYGTVVTGPPKTIQYRYIANVRDGEEDHDAVNLAQVKSLIAEGGGGSSAKLYSEYGDNEDGAVTQKFISDKLNKSTVAIGYNTTVSSDASVALGGGAKSTNVSTIAIGKAEATSNNTIAMGPNAKASQLGAVRSSFSFTNSNSRYVSGFSTTTKSHASIARHGSAVTQKFISDKLNKSTVAIGYNTTVSSDASVALGGGAKSTNVSTIAIGKAEATSNNTIAMGPNAKASQLGAVAIGMYALANATGAVALGTGSQTQEKGVIQVGVTSTNVSAHYYAYSDDGLRVIRGVHPAVKDNDAVSFIQMKEYVEDHAGGGSSVEYLSVEEFEQAWENA